MPKHTHTQQLTIGQYNKAARTPTFLRRSPTMLRADILVDGVKRCVPANVVCIGVPWGDGFALINGDVSMGMGGAVGSCGAC